ncbi:NirD/YgiW/YdeI family stress tolerance protein [Pasteurellaceae bacterium 22721_9_1]
MALGFAALSASSFAHKHDNGCFVNNNQPVSTVAQAKTLDDDQLVVLQGKIVKQIGKEDFLFRDASGEIAVEIDKELWKGEQITPNDEVKFYGEVDKSANKSRLKFIRLKK